MDKGEHRRLDELLGAAAETYGSQAAFMIREHGGFRGISYREVDEQAKSLGRGLIKQGLEGKHIAVIGENRYEWILAFLAIVNYTGICVSLDMQLKEEELEHLLRKGDVDAVIYSARVRPQILRVRERLAGRPLLLIAMDGDENEETAADCRLGELLEGGRQTAGEIVCRLPQPDEMRMIMFTSGTMGQARGVMLSHKNLCSNVMQGAARRQLRAGGKVLSFLPIHHIYELSYGILNRLYQGCTIYFSRGVRYLAADLKEVRPHYFSAVPMVLDNFYRTAVLKAGNGDSETCFINLLGGEVEELSCGAAPLSREVHQALKMMSFQFVVGYGLTETSPVISIDGASTRVGACGQVLDGMQVQLHEPDEHGAGELWVKGDSVMLGYYKDAESTAEAMTDGWFHTGDVGYLEDDYLFLTGRKKNIIVLSNGKKVSPEELEGELAKFPEIHTSVCQGITEDGEVRIAAEIYPDMDYVRETYHTTETAAVEIIVKQKIEEFNRAQAFYKQIVRTHLRTTDFPRTTTNKIKRM